MPVAVDLLAFDDDADEPFALAFLLVFESEELLDDLASCALLVPDSEELLDALAACAGADSCPLALALAVDARVVALTRDVEERLEDLAKAAALFGGGAAAAASFLLALPLAFDVRVVALALDVEELLEDFAKAAALFAGGAAAAASLPLALALAFDALGGRLAFASGEPWNDLATSTLDLLVFEADGNELLKLFSLFDDDFTVLNFLRASEAVGPTTSARAATANSDASFILARGGHCCLGVTLKRRPGGRCSFLHGTRTGEGL